MSADEDKDKDKKVEEVVDTMREALSDKDKQIAAFKDFLLKVGEIEQRLEGKDWREFLTLSFEEFLTIHFYREREITDALNFLMEQSDPGAYEEYKKRLLEEGR